MFSLIFKDFQQLLTGLRYRSVYALAGAGLTATAPVLLAPLVTGSASTEEHVVAMLIFVLPPRPAMHETAEGGRYWRRKRADTGRPAVMR